MHKSVKSTSQKHKTKERSSSDIQNESGIVSIDSVGVFEEISFYNEKRKIGRLFFNKNLEHYNIDVSCSGKAQVIRPPIFPIYTGYKYFRNFNTEIYDYITANVVFDSTLDRWLAICDQLKITTHAEDINSVVSKLEEILNNHDNVCDNYQLSVNYTKNVKKHGNRINSAPYFFKVIESADKQYIFESVAITQQSAIHEHFLQLEKKLSKLVGKKVKEINEIPHQEINEFPHIDIDKLARLAEEESYTMPRGLTREQRREWARKNLKR